MSLDNHSALIEQLKPLLMEPNFQEIFQQLTVDENNSTRFLLKMELNRLASPCTRIIDLRDKSELPCSEVMLGQQRHFLDEPAKHSLQEAMSLYRNKYTLGVYEYVIAAHQLRRQKFAGSDTYLYLDEPSRQVAFRIGAQIKHPRKICLVRSSKADSFQHSS